MANPQELFDIVDDENNVIGEAARGECHGNPQLVHRAVHVLLFNQKNELLLQKRPYSKDIQPGKWDTSVGGHLDRGESFRAAARREMFEELGLSDVALTYLYASKIRNEIESENVETFLAVTDRKPEPAPEEVVEVRFWGAAEIERLIGQGVFTPNFEVEWEMLKDFCRKYQNGRSASHGLCAGDSFPELFARLHEE